AAAEAAGFALGEWDRALEQEVSARLIERDVAACALPAREATVHAAEERARVTGDRYREGVSLSSDLLDAEIARQAAESDLTRARIEWRLAELRLRHALGRPIP